jgi:hypothetical protein
MIRTVALAVSVLLLTAWSSFAAAKSSPSVPPELKQQFEQLISKDTEARAAAYLLLEKSGNGALVPALEAFRSGLLERRTDGRLVIYLPRVDVKGQSMFPVVDAWTLEPLKQTDGSPLYAAGLGSSMLKSDSTQADSLARLIGVLSIPRSFLIYRLSSRQSPQEKRPRHSGNLSRAFNCRPGRRTNASQPFKLWKNLAPLGVSQIFVRRSIPPVNPATHRWFRQSTTRWRQSRAISGKFEWCTTRLQDCLWEAFSSCLRLASPSSSASCASSTSRTVNS